MRWRLRRQENEGGEWSVLDPSLDYRICHYNHEHHRGTHLHYPSESRAGPNLTIGSAAEADSIMRHYHEKHGAFNLDALKEVIKTWKSESNGN